MIVTARPRPSNPGNFTMANVGGSWDFGVAKIYGFYNENKWNDLKQAVYEISGSVPIGQLELRAVYGHADAKGNPYSSASPGVMQHRRQRRRPVSVEGVYNLSKRTAIYATYAEIKNKGKAAFTVLPAAPMRMRP